MSAPTITVTIPEPRTDTSSGRFNVHAIPAMRARDRWVAGLNLHHMHRVPVWRRERNGGMRARCGQLATYWEEPAPNDGPIPRCTGCM